MSTVSVQTSGDTPDVLPVFAADAIAAAQTYLALTISVLTEVNQTGLTVQEYAAVAAAAASTASQAAAAATANYAVAHFIAKGRTNVNDANYQILASDYLVAMIALTAPRTLTLPLASAYNSGQPLYVVDESGSCSATNTITILANSSGSESDTIAAQASVIMGSPYQKLVFHSNGYGLWTYSG